MIETQNTNSFVPSPCINICLMDASTGWCTGCMRTIDEIATWGNISNAARGVIVADLPRREEAFYKGTP